MKNIRFILFSLNVVLFCHWHSLQHGHCSEQNKPGPQNKTTPDTAELENEPKEDRTDDELLSSTAPGVYTSEHSSQTDTGTEEEQSTLAKVERTTAEGELTPEAGVSEPDPDQTVPETSTPQEQDPNSEPTDPPLLPAVPGTASQATQVSDSLPSEATALPSLAPCGVDDSCISASITAVSSMAACDGGETPPYDSILASDLPMVLENASTTGAGKDTKGSLDRASQGTNASSRLEEQDVPVTMETDPSVPSKDPEDIPTFDEWKKIMMEVENEKSQTAHTSCNGGSSAVKKVQKTTNYASVECGAKILSSNPEAKSTSAILMENMDMYMLNPCSNKIWFVIELCQPIQVKQLDIANFELFSSTPKDFLVSISDRYPTSKWAKLGTFHGRDERTIQSFPLDEHLYAKYIKVELLSHFGSEHFCPLSLVRVFGTSMMEEYELNSESSDRLTFQDEDYDDPPRYAHSDDKTSKNLIKSAKDVILNMVNNIASNVLGGNPEDKSGGNYSSPDLNLMAESETQATPSTSSDMTLETSKVDQHNLDEIPETPPVREDKGGYEVEDVPTASLSETSSAVLPEVESLIPQPPGKEQIVTLLPKEEGEESESLDQSEQPSGSASQEEEEQSVKAKRDWFSGVRECANCSEFSPYRCCCVLSLHEHLLQKCFPLEPHKNTKEIRKMVQHSQSQHSTYLQETHTPLVISSSGTQELHTWTVEASSLPVASTKQVVHPPFPESERKAEEGHLDLAPSLTSTLLDPASTPNLNYKATEPVHFLDPQALELSAVQLPVKEQSREKPRDVNKSPLSTSPSEPTSDQVLATTPQSVLERSTAEKDTLKASVMTGTLDQSPFTSPSTSTEQSSPQPAMTRSTAAAGTFTPAPNTAPWEGTAVEPRAEELLEDLGLGQLGQPSPTEFYAELLSSTDAPVHGSNQKESVFMRLNNRIKALEVNMSLSGRYLEQLSQRYRKQMEEMQKAFNKTIIKLQNTSRMAEDQDQKQTESIQVLQGQLENVTQLLLNLSVRVSQLQSEVSDRHSYLLLCFVLCLLLGLVLCTNFCCMSAENPSTEPDVSLQKTYGYSCSERASVGYEDVSLMRRASFPLTQSSLLIPPTKGPHEAYSIETQRNITGNKKKKRCKMKSRERPETITPTLLSVPNGLLPWNGGPPHGSDLKLSGSSRGPDPPPSSLRSPPSEGSSEASSQSDEPSFCGIAPCRRLCDGLPPPNSQSERSSYKRRRSKAGSSVAEQPLQPVRCTGPPVGPGPSLCSFTGGRGGGYDRSALS